MPGIFLEFWILTVEVLCYLLLPVLLVGTAKLRSVAETLPYLLSSRGSSARFIPRFEISPVSCKPPSSSEG